MLTKEQVQAIRLEYDTAEGNKPEVFDVMYANFDQLLDTADVSAELLAACEVAQKQTIHASNDKKAVLSDQLTKAWLILEQAIAAAEK